MTFEEVMTAQEIKKFRLGLNLTQEQFARELKTTCNTVNKWENGHTKPSKLALESMRRYVKDLKEMEQKKGKK